MLWLIVTVLLILLTIWKTMNSMSANAADNFNKNTVLPPWLLQRLTGLDEKDRETSEIWSVMEVCCSGIVQGYRQLANTGYRDISALKILTNSLLTGLKVEDKLLVKLHKDIHRIIVNEEAYLGFSHDDNRFYKLLMKGVERGEPYSCFMNAFANNYYKFSVENQATYEGCNFLETLETICANKTHLPDTLIGQMLSAVAVASGSLQCADEDEKDDPDGDLMDLHNARRWNESNRSARFKTALFHVKRVASSKGGVTADVKDKFCECISELKDFIKQSPNDGNYRREAYTALAFMYMFTKDEAQAKLYFKQALYAAERIPEKLQLADVSVQQMEKMLQWKFPDVACRSHCDQCDKKTSEGGRVKRCPCTHAFYCGADCQKKHWPIHKHVCTVKKVDRKVTEQLPLMGIPYLNYVPDEETDLKKQALKIRE